jgi:hypothetical protein
MHGSTGNAEAEHVKPSEAERMTMWVQTGDARCPMLVSLDRALRNGRQYQSSIRLVGLALVPACAVRLSGRLVLLRQLEQPLSVGYSSSSRIVIPNGCASL